MRHADPVPTILPAVVAIFAAGVLALGAASAATPTAAQEEPFTGTWDVTWDQAIRSAGSRVLEVQRRGTAVLTLEQHADSLEGSWSIPGTDQTHRVVGSVRGDSLHLDAPDAVVRDGGRAIPVTMRWHGVIADGQITGTMYLQIRAGDAPPRAWEAVRHEG